MRERIRHWLKGWLDVEHDYLEVMQVVHLQRTTVSQRFDTLEDELTALKARLTELESPFGPIESKPKPEPEPVKVGMGMVPLSRRKAAFELANRKQAEK